MWAAGGGDKFGDMSWGQPTSDYFKDRIEFPFFDACLRGDGRPKLPGAQVFETGANRWREFATWPPPRRKETDFYLLPGKRVGTEPAPASQTEYDEYVSDPANPVPYQGGRITGRTREYMIDDQRFSAQRSDVLTYQTSALTRDLRIAGPIAVGLQVQTSSTDADFIVKVIDVFPDSAPGKLAGYEMLLRADVMRARFRNSYENPAPLSPDKIEAVNFDLNDVFHTFLPGHRLMIQVQSSWFPLVDRNPQQYEDIATARPQDFHKATIRIYHTADHPSRIRVGVL
jgi:putative CocE/NonD family hydrolase